MEISAHIAANLYVAVIEWAAQHGTSVENVLATALTEYMVDVDCGLLAPPQITSATEIRIMTRLRGMVESAGRGWTPPPHARA